MKKQKKPYFSLYILFFLSLIFLSCGNEKKADSSFSSPNFHTIIFIDKTESVDVGKAFVAQKYQQALNSIIEENLRKAGDRFEIYYIHENTSKGRCLSLMCRTEMENTEGMNSTDLEATKTAYDLSIRRERNLVKQQSFAKLNAQNEDVSKQETNITQSLPIISRASEAGNIVKVFYFSDMVESVKSGRDFHVKPPKDNSEAESWAKADSDKMKNLSLANTDISMILPFEPTTSSKENNPTVTFYWQKIFENLGAINIIEQ